MARMEKCCCFDVRGGSIASAIYSMIYTVILIIVAVVQFVQVTKIAADLVENTDLTQVDLTVYHAVFGVAVGFQGFLFLASVIMLIGVVNSNKWMLIPYMVANVLLLILQAVGVAALQVSVGYSTPFFIGLLFYVAINCLNGLCIRCVISHYRNLRDEERVGNRAMHGYN